MRYQDYNSICRKRSKLPDRGNLSKQDYTSQQLWIFLKLDEHKEKLLSTIFQVLQFVIRGLVSLCQLIFQNSLNCMFNHLFKKKNVVYVS